MNINTTIKFYHFHQNLSEFENMEENRAAQTSRREDEYIVPDDDISVARGVVDAHDFAMSSDTSSSSSFSEESQGTSASGTGNVLDLDHQHARNDRMAIFLEELSKKKEELEIQVLDLTSKANRYDVLLKVLEKEKIERGQLQIQITAMTKAHQSEVEGLKIKNAQIHADLNLARNEIEKEKKKHSSSAATWEQKGSELISQLSGMQSQLDEEKTKLIDANSECENLRQENGKLTKKLEDVNHDLDALKIEKSNVEKELHEVDSKLTLAKGVCKENLTLIRKFLTKFNYESFGEEIDQDDEIDQKILFNLVGTAAMEQDEVSNAENSSTENVPNQSTSNSRPPRTCVPKPSIPTAKPSTSQKKRKLSPESKGKK